MAHRARVHEVVLLPLPLAVVGLVLGLLRVLRRGILFKSRGVELATEFVVGWGGTALIVWVVMGITDSLEAVIGSGRARPVYLAVPVATALLISLAGWLPSREID